MGFKRRSQRPLGQLGRNMLDGLVPAGCQAFAQLSCNRIPKGLRRIVDDEENPGPPEPSHLIADVSEGARCRYNSPRQRLVGEFHPTLPTRPFSVQNPSC